MGMDAVELGGGLQPSGGHESAGGMEADSLGRRIMTVVDGLIP